VERAPKAGLAGDSSAVSDSVDRSAIALEIDRSASAREIDGSAIAHGLDSCDAAHEPERSAVADADVSRYCPVCSQRLESRRCKLICPVCGYYMSCADYY
jgi:hypothetical protein